VIAAEGNIVSVVMADDNQPINVDCGTLQLSDIDLVVGTPIQWYQFDADASNQTSCNSGSQPMLDTWCPGDRLEYFEPLACKVLFYYNKAYCLVLVRPSSALLFTCKFRRIRHKILARL
jgi:hypothetical protein